MRQRLSLMANRLESKARLDWNLREKFGESFIEGSASWTPRHLPNFRPTISVEELSIPDAQCMVYLPTFTP